jgi:hypothetical protein
MVANAHIHVGGRMTVSYDYTKHGLHLNLSGKEHIFLKVAVTNWEFLIEFIYLLFVFNGQIQIWLDSTVSLAKTQISKLLPEAEALINKDEKGKLSQLSK